MSHKFETVKCNFNESSTKVSYTFTVAMFSPMFAKKPVRGVGGLDEYLAFVFSLSLYLKIVLLAGLSHQLQVQRQMPYSPPPWQTG